MNDSNSPTQSTAAETHENDESGRSVGRRRLLQSAAVLGAGGLFGTAAADRGTDSPAATETPPASQTDPACDETPIAIQQYTVRNLGSAPEVTRRVAEAGYDAVEYYAIDDVAAVETALDETGLSTAGMHLGLDALTGSSLEETVERFEPLGVTNFVVASAGEEFFASEEAVVDLAEQMNEIADRLPDGLDLVYHNHAYEFACVDSGRAFDLFVAETNDDVLYQIDTGLAAAGGADPVALIERLGERVDTIHFRDMQVDVLESEARYVDLRGVGYDFAEIGAGDLDVEAIAAAARDVGVDALIYEHNTDAQAETLQVGAEVLQTLDTDPDCETGGGGTADPTSYTVPQTGGGVSNEVAFTLAPEGETYTDTDGDGDTTGPDDLSADVHLGYDAQALYAHVVVTDDVHSAVSGSSMWQADSVQLAVASDGTYGPEYGVSHVDGETSLHRWIEGNAATGTETLGASTAREDSATVYQVALPWTALFASGEAPAPGESFPFGVLVNERDDGNGRDAVLGSALPGINAEKTPDALGTLTLADN
jgi:sugar phosphate isomerase/epimerase